MSAELAVKRRYGAAHTPGAAPTGDGFLRAFAEAGFHGIQVLKRAAVPCGTVDGIELRSVTVQAFKGKQGPSLGRNQAIVCLGPFKEVLDDDSRRMTRRAPLRRARLKILALSAGAVSRALRACAADERNPAGRGEAIQLCRRAAPLSPRDERSGRVP